MPQRPGLNWFSPLPPSATDIAHFTARLAPALEREFKVRLWVDSDDVAREVRLQPDVRRYHLPNAPWPEVNSHGLTAYQIGNDAQFHAGIYGLSRRHSGIIFLHDFSLHQFFEQVLRRPENGGDAAYLGALQRLYGREARDAGKAFLDSGEGMEELAEAYPMTDLVLENASGVVVLNPQLKQKVAELTKAPVAVLPIPWRDGISAVAPNRIPASANTGRVELISFGYFGGPNRRLEVTFEVLASLPRRDEFHLSLYGMFADQPGLEQKVAELGIQNLVTFRGFVAEKELDKALSQADLAINLRWPSRGEASGSQLRIWSHAIPSIVTRTGWYADQPSSTLAMVSPNWEKQDLRGHLENYLSHPKPYLEMGYAGREHLRRYHLPDRFATQLRAFVPEVEAHSKFNWQSRMATRTARLIGNGFPREARRFLIESSSEVIHEWIGENPRNGTHAKP